VVRMSLPHVSRPAVAEEFIPREVRESLDEVIERELLRREREASSWTGLFTTETNAQQTGGEPLLSSGIADYSECQQEVAKPIPGVGTDGEITDMQAFKEHCQIQETRSAVRREEVNINHARSEREDMGEYSL